jgi:cupin 2 domain-containing protein
MARPTQGPAAEVGMTVAGNLFADLAPAAEEQFATLAAGGQARIERIVSSGQASPPGFWYDQDEAEWVVLLTGAAGLRFADEAETRVLRPGDHLLIPAHRRHRVEWTDAQGLTVWLAVHFSEDAIVARMEPSRAF